MLRLDRRQQNSVKQVPFNKKKKNRKKKKKNYEVKLEGRNNSSSSQFGKGNKHTQKFQEINKNNVL